MLNEVNLIDSSVERDYKGEGYIVVIEYEDVIEGMYYVEDEYKVRNNDGSVDINVLGLLKDNGVNVNELIENGRGVWFGKCKDWVFRVMNRIV